MEEDEDDFAAVKSHGKDSSDMKNVENETQDLFKKKKMVLFVVSAILLTASGIFLSNIQTTKGLEKSLLSCKAPLNIHFMLLLC